MSSSRSFAAGSTLKQKGLVAGVLAVLGAGSVALGGASLESVLNAGIAAVLFNIIYDTLLGAKLKWHALCPVIDTMNHSSTSKVNTHSADAHGLVCTQARQDPGVTLWGQVGITHPMWGQVSITPPMWGQVSITPPM